MGKQYCCICSNFRGKSLGRGTVSLHRLPSDKYVRSLWVRRLKLVRRDLSVTKHTEICSVHFVGGKGPSDKNDIPSVFPKKTFTASKINQVQPSSNCDSRDDASEPSAELHQINQESGDQSPTNFIQRERSNDVVSLMLHDYCCEPVPEENISTFRYMSTQTEQKDCRTLGTQTDEGFLLALDPVKTSSTMTQTTEESTPEFVSQATQVQMPDISYYDVKDDPDLLNFYTGIDSSSFKCIFSELSEIHDVETPSSSTGRPKSLSLIDEFFLVLMRLRLGLLIVDLSKRFHISKSCCADIISKWIDLLYNNLSFLITWPSRDTINITMPKSFKDLFPSTRVVIDCTELYTEKPYSLSKQSQMYSHYKSHMTYKSLIGVTPNGVVSFVSDLWSGSISDRQITVQSGLLDLCESGDGIMADKGFTISDLTTARAMYLIIPPRKQKRKQLSAIEIEQTRRIANLRIHVERHMERVKNFRILQGIIPITISKSVNKIWKICNALTCLLPPLYPHQTENDEDNNILFDETFIQEQ